MTASRGSSRLATTGRIGRRAMGVGVRQSTPMICGVENDVWKRRSID